MFNRNLELRNLPASALSNVANILEINKDWQKVVPLIPKNIFGSNFERKYNWQQIQLIEDHASKTNRTFAEVLFDEWGTSGKVRPTLDTLMKILEEAQIFRALDDLAAMIKEPPPPRPKTGPGAPITTNLTDILNDESLEQKLNSINTVCTSDLRTTSQDNICNQTTVQLKEPSDLIKLPKIIINDDKLYPKDVSDMMKFSVTQSHSASISDNVPNLTDMLADATGAVDSSEVSSILSESGSIDNTTSNTTDTSSQNDLSRFIPNLHPLSSTSNRDIYDIIDKAILEDENLIKFDYKDLEVLTNKFSETLIEKPSGPVGKIGSGGFGDVFVGIHKKFGPLAIKKVRLFHLLGLDLENIMKIFNTEVKSLSILRHQNIVPIFGYSIDGPTPCLVCEYIDGGSLSQKIAAKVLSEQQRIDILRGTAEGLKYIHKTEAPQQTDNMFSDTQSQSQKKSYYLHGDVKSANILLTKDCLPKLCDFGLAKQLDTTIITRSMMGTSAYMAPEGFSGNITQKNDIFSFGIVMLELLTGLKPIVTTSGENMNIKDYIEENCPDGDITLILDKVVPNWTKHHEIYKLATNCLQLEKKYRPTIDYVCNTLSNINNGQV